MCSQTANFVDDGESTVAHCYHLAESAGLKGGGHQQEVGTGINAAAESLAVADIGADLAAVAHFALTHGFFVSAVAGAQKDEGGAGGNYAVNGLQNNVEALLACHTGDHGNDGGIVLDFQTQLFNKSQLAARLAAKVIGGEVEGQLGVGLGIENLGIQTVYNSAQVIAAIDEALQFFYPCN